MNNAFLESNIELKVKDLQKEHNIVLKKIFENYNEIVVNSNTSQYFKYSCILQKLKGIVDEETLKICLNDLEVKGFIFQNTRGHNDEWGYAITYLGKKAIQFWEI